jgi:hypothetical protein
MSKISGFKIISFVLLLFLILVLAYGEILNFSFWKDDWINIWLVINKNPIFLTHWIHPGTLADFFVLGSLFGDRVIFWQITGFIIRVVCAVSVGIFISELTYSPKAGIISAIIETVSVLGLDSLTWVASRVVMIDSILISLGMYYWLRFLRTGIKIKLINGLSFICLAIMADPGRILPLPLIILGTFLFESSKKLNYFKQNKLKIILIILGIMFLLTLWQWRMIQETVVYKFFIQIDLTPKLIQNKIYVLGNYFCSIYYMYIGWVFKLPENLSTGTYNRIYSRVGLIPIFTFLLLLIVGLYKKRRTFLIFSWLLFWTLIFYLPGFFAEPRLTMGVSHRYMEIPGIGLIGMIGYILSKQNQVITILGLILVVTVNIIIGKSLIKDWKVFRADALVTTIWQTIDRDIGTSTGEKIISLTGIHPVIGNNIGMSGQIPLMVIRQVSNLSEFSQLVNDSKEIVSIICTPRSSKIILDGSIVAAKNLDTDDVYSWEVSSDGSLTNNTQLIRRELKSQLFQKGCNGYN